MGGRETLSGWIGIGSLLLRHSNATNQVKYCIPLFLSYSKYPPLEVDWDCELIAKALKCYQPGMNILIILPLSPFFPGYSQYLSVDVLYILFGWIVQWTRCDDRK